jgi:hypothetical protein
VIECPANITVNAVPGQCNSNVTFTVTATDVCAVASLVSVPPSGFGFPVGTTTVTSTARDSSGNSSQCTFTVTVVDNQPPVLTCPANITANAVPGTCGSNVTFSVTATDNCGVTNVVSMPPSGFAFQVGTTTVTSTARDSSGNSSQCTFNVTVVDNQPPVLTCPANITVNAVPGTCGSNVTFSVTATDNCAVTNMVSLPPSGFAFQVGTTTVTNTARDSSGNSSQCTFTVTVQDKQLPVLSGLPPASLSVQCLADVPPVATVTASDNCEGSMPITYTPSESGDPCNRTISRTWSAIDSYGNTATFTQTITVHDDTNPSLTTGTIAASYVTVAEAEAAALAATDVSDNCSAVTKTVSRVGDCPIVITVTGTDSCGNQESVSYNTCISTDLRLAIVRHDTSVTVSWPFPSTGFVLESTTTLNPPNWQPVVDVLLIAGEGRWRVVLPVDQAQLYLRLHKP